MNKNDIIDLEITSYNSKGDGVAKKDEFVFFVPFAIIGETVKVKVLKIKKNIVYCKLIEVLNKSSIRCEPMCESFIKCGGCSLLHINYNEQLILKRNKVIETLKRIGGIETFVSDTVSINRPFNYRNKAFLPVSENKDGEIIAGFYRKNTHDVVDLNNCILQDEDLFKIVKIIKEWMKKYSIKPYDEKNHKGIIRHIYFRKGIHTNEIMAGVVTFTNELPYKKELIDMLLQAKGITSVIQNVNNQITNVILGDKVNVLYGNEYIFDKILGKTFKIGSLSFYQVNPYTVEKLYQIGIDLLELNKNDIIFDIYCGIGTIGICTASDVKKVIGVEVVKEAIKLAKENAEINKLTNTKFYVGKAEDVIYNLKGDIPNKIILDPTRTGCDERLINEIKKMNPEKILYISCDVATLSRDLKIFTSVNQYSVAKVIPVDMFPNTPHVECVVLITRVK